MQTTGHPNANWHLDTVTPFTGLLLAAGGLISVLALGGVPA